MQGTEMPSIQMTGFPRYNEQVILPWMLQALASALNAAHGIRSDMDIGRCLAYKQNALQKIQVKATYPS